MKKPTRRQVLGYSAATLGAAGVGVIPLSRDPLYRSKYPQVAENNVELPSNGKTVCVMGGGVAGLQAGVELSSRGFKVILLEKRGMPGGKLQQWRDKSFGPDDHPLKKAPDFKGFPREHGVHAVWGYYNNFREFLGRFGYKLLSPPKDMSIYTFIDKDGTQSHIPKTTWPAPYNRIQNYLDLTKINHLNKDQVTTLMELMQKFSVFDYSDKKQRDYLDSMTVADYVKKIGISDEALLEFIDGSIEMVNFDSSKHTSALGWGQFVQETAGAPEDLLDVDIFENPPGETFLKPMADYILSKGGEVHYNTEITKLEIIEEQISSVETNQLGRQKLRRCQVCGELIPGDAHHYECPFCGAEGAQLKDLTESEKSKRSFEADYFITAMDTVGMQRLVRANLQEKAFSSHSYFTNILDLHSKEVTVVNLWFEGKNHWDNAIKGPVFFGTGFDQLSLTINWAFQMPDIDGNVSSVVSEYTDYDISILETQIAKTHNIVGLSTKEIADKCYEEYKIVMPDLPPYQSYYVNRVNNYTRWLPGDENKRPAIQSPIDNLLFIGDAVFIPQAATLMEKTNVTAKIATNIILEKSGQKEGVITLLPTGTPSRLVDFMRKFVSVEV